MRLTTEALLSFERFGHCTTKGLLPADSVTRLAPPIENAFRAAELDAYRQKVRVLLGDAALAEVQTDRGGKPGRELAALRDLLAAVPQHSVPFLQAFNLWRRCDEVASLACSPQLAGTAAALLGCTRVRLYQDSLFVKRAGDGPTHWHSDLAMAPLDTNAFLTVWLPLQPIPSDAKGGSGLVFARGSHRDVSMPVASPHGALHPPIHPRAVPSYSLRVSHTDAPTLRWRSTSGMGTRATRATRRAAATASTSWMATASHSATPRGITGGRCTPRPATGCGIRGVPSRSPILQTAQRASMRRVVSRIRRTPRAMRRGWPTCAPALRRGTRFCRSSSMTLVAALSASTRRPDRGTYKGHLRTGARGERRLRVGARVGAARRAL